MMKSISELNGSLIKGRGIEMFKKFSIFMIWMTCMLLFSNTALFAQAPPPYCEQTGGDTTYESITSVTPTINPDGTTIKLTVNVDIENPQNCVSGQPCTFYDGSPEYVNVWIDWDGSQTFDADEKVMDVAATGYLNINYQGTMSLVRQINIPAQHAGVTYMRANLGWDFDPNDPCGDSDQWDWGNVVDQEIAIGAEAPIITDLQIYPKFPKAETRVVYEPTIMEVDGFSIENVSFITEGLDSGDVATGDNGYIYSFIPPAGSRGRKSVTVTVTYKNLSNDETGKSVLKKNINMFFDKDEKDVNDTPNWYTYWKIDDAVPGIADTIYDDKYAYGYSSGADTVALSWLGSGQYYSSAIGPVGPAGDQHSFGGPSVWGIDTAAEVIAHEKRHQEITGNWLAGGIWNGMTDSDFQAATGLNGWLRDKNDKLPDDFETAVPSANNNTDTFNLAALKSPVYKYSGDSEYQAMLAGGGSIGYPGKDWAYPGKQSNPERLSTAAYWGEAPPLLPETQATDYVLGVTTSEGSYLSGKRPLTKGVTSVNQQDFSTQSIQWLTDTYTESVTDSDSNGLYDSLNINIGVNIPEQLHYLFIGWLEDSSGNEIGWAQFSGTLDAGAQTVTLHFAGSVLGASELDGPYKLSLLEIRDPEDMYVFYTAGFAYTTEFYSYLEFEYPEATIDPILADTVQDLDVDGFYDVLNISGSVTGVTSAENTVVGWLYTSEGVLIGGAEASITGSSFSLSFDGLKIRQTGTNGPYELRDISIIETLSDHSQYTLHTLPDAFNTQAYSFTDFEKGSAQITGSVDAAIDTDADAKADILRVTLNLNVITGGSFLLSAILVDSDNNIIDESSAAKVLGTGSQSIAIDFSGGKIYANLKNGPYSVRNIKLIDNEGKLADKKTSGYPTSAYSYTDFGQPLVRINGDVTSVTVDDNEDTKYETLTLLIPVRSPAGGIILGDVQMVNGLGEHVAWGTGDVSVNANVNGVLPIIFSGDDIRNSGHNGPYYFTNINIYNSGDPAKNITGDLDYSTVFYKATDFSFTLLQIMPLSSGWNLISLPVQPGETLLETVLEPVSGLYNIVWAYVAGEWTMNNPSTPIFNTLLTMEAGKGYWIYMAQPGTLELSGGMPSSSMQLGNGWNLVGYNSDAEQPTAAALDSITGQYISVWAFINNEWLFYNPENILFSTLETMQPGYGYWINTNQACTWTLP